MTKYKNKNKKRRKVEEKLREKTKSEEKKKKKKREVAQASVGSKTKTPIWKCDKEQTRRTNWESNAWRSQHTSAECFPQDIVNVWFWNSPGTILKRIVDEQTPWFLKISHTKAINSNKNQYLLVLLIELCYYTNLFKHSCNTCDGVGRPDLIDTS